jgi:CBS domain-containing protein
MSFFLSTNGQLHSYHFKYLDGDFEKARLEKTEVHLELLNSTPKTAPLKQKEFYAIEVMNSPVITLAPSSLLEIVRETMKNYNIRHIPIIKNKKILGMISDRDLLKIDLSGTFPFLHAQDIMTSVLIVANEETPLAHIARVLMEEKISAIPIINAKNELIGMISRTDILKAVIYNRLILK